jgi:hypothetical protein
MDKHIIELREQLLRAWFDSTNARVVLEWLIAAEDRAPVVLVGAGFSRNARHKHRGDYARPSEVPLWWDIATQMATHLRVDRNRYDAPTMAEMYASSFGEAELRDLLCSMLPDDDLDAGPAHFALGRYSAEAVITTNLLDTLLEKAKTRQGDLWNRVIADADLSARTKGARRSTDLVYFHGHRCASDTWIMTRSQFEDVAKRKPVVVARVRQLLAQRPLLVVGFGMGDPNFHNVYRQMGSDMQHHHPLGLAIQLTELPEAERRHWMALGLRIAVPARGREIQDDATTSNAFFAWLFQHLSTSWSPDDDATNAYVQDATDPQERFERFRGILPHHKRRADGAERYQEQASEFDAWKKTLFSFLTEADEADAKANVKKISEDDYQKTFGKKLSGGSVPTAGDGQASGQAGQALEAPPPGRPPPTFSQLPEWVPTRIDDAWRLDLVLRRTASAWPEVARHFHLALERELFRTEGAELGFLPWIPLTFWIAVKAKRADEKALAAIASECLDAARKYGDTQWEEIIGKEAQNADVTLAADGATEKPADDNAASPERAGFRAMLDGDHEAALGHYRKAADGAMAEGDEFEEWVWRQGEQLALSAATDPFRTGGVISDERRRILREEKDRCDERIHALAETSLVRSWLERTGTRMRRILTYALERCEARAIHRARGGSGASFNSDPHMAWRSFRDLEAIDAPPHLQQRYFEPLLWESGFKPEAEFRYRMLFDVRKTEEWLDRLLDSPSGTVKAQEERDTKLVSTFFPDDGHLSRSELLGRLLAFPGLKEAFRRQDVAKLPGWLAHARATLGLEVTTYSAHRYLDREYARALTAVATIARSDQVRPLMEAWRKDTRAHEREELASAAYRLPWFRWGLTEPAEVVAWIRSMTDEVGTDSRVENSAVRREDEVLAFALWRMAHEVRESAPALLDPEVQSRLQGFAERLHGLAVLDDHVWEARRGGYLLEHVLRQGGDSPPTQLYDRWASTEGWTDPGGTGRRELRWSLVADEHDELESGGTEPHALVERVQVLWREVEDEATWRRIAKHYALNPHYAIPVVRFLVTCLLLLDDCREAAAARLLPLLAAAPSTLRHVAPALTPAAWASAWSSFVDQVVASASGAASTQVATSRSPYDDSGASTEHQLGAIGLWADGSYRARRGQATIPSVLDWPLRAATLLALADERTLVANHAAYALVAAAETIAAPDDSTLITQALRRISRDTRVNVRMAAAYGGARLKSLAKSLPVLEAAAQVDAAMADDQNAVISVQREVGRLQAEREQRRS